MRGDARVRHNGKLNTHKLSHSGMSLIAKDNCIVSEFVLFCYGKHLRVAKNILPTECFNNNNNNNDIYTAHFSKRLKCA